MSTKIEWTDETWNPVTGCNKISDGCKNCYAEKMARRLAGRYGYPKADPFSIALHEDKLNDPLHWKKPRRVFVCSMGDLFHSKVPDEYIYKIFDVMRRARSHTYQILTKRPGNIKEKLGPWYQWIEYLIHIWIGVTVEDPCMAVLRIPRLLETPAAVRYISIEPMLDPINLDKWIDRIDWVIVGGETGAGARPVNADWVRSIRDQCIESKTPFFFKGWGEYSPRDGKRAPIRFGKRIAGRHLDGETWEQFPA